ncbi:MAG: PAS domain-containing protein [Planctomycetota bacterium]
MSLVVIAAALYGYKAAQRLRRRDRQLADQLVKYADLNQVRCDLEGQLQRLERATNGALDGLWDYEPATGAVWYSDQFKRLVGLEPEHFDDFKPYLDSFANLLHPQDKDETFAAVEAHLQRDATYDVDYRLRMPNGSYRWFRARGQAVRDENGTPVRMSGSITDIDDQHTAESRLDLATKSARIGLWDWDVPSGQTYFNDTFYTMLGYEPGELPMCLDTWKDIAHPDDLDSAMQDIEAHLENRTRIYINEHRLRKKDGSWLWVRDIGEVVERHASGEPKRMIGVHVDIDAIKQAGEALVEAREAAEAASHAKSEFLANMSHEIRTPMTAILGYADLLQSEGGFASDPEQAADAVRTIRGNANHLLAIINDILDMSKIEAGRMTVESLATNPAQIVEEVVSLLRPRAAGKGVDLRIRYDGTIPEHIHSDPTRLRQILLNLTGNAIKFTEVGSVTIAVSCQRDEQQLTFRVIDTGIGLTEQQRDAIAKFDSFTQADTSTTRKFGGTGLGLKISNAFAQILGGGIHITSEEGRGSTFTVSIGTGDLDGVAMLNPEALPQRTRGEFPKPQPKKSSNALVGVRILLAEDGPDNQKLISFLLRRAGAEVTIADNGRIAAEAIENAAPEDLPHIVLMDMQMPELDGYSATRRLRSAGCTLPIVALTAHAMDGDRAKCLDAGCDDFLSKPIDKVKLIETCARRAGCPQTA